MDAKLKGLKVAELKQILAEAKITYLAKSTKSDLITKIQESEEALNVYAQLHPPDDLLAPPEE
jgi:SAP domain-containing ribonucleoprotein